MGKLWRDWVLANTIGGALGWGAVVVLAFPSWGASVLFAGPIAGTCVALAQRHYLQYRIQSLFGSTWLWQTILSSTLCWFLPALLRALLISKDIKLLLHPLAPLLYFLVGGSAFGLVQWMVLRRFFRRAWLWICACAISWSIGAFVGLWIADRAVQLLFPGYEYGAGIILGYGEFLQVFLAGFIATIIFATVTGWFLAWFLSESQSRGNLLQDVTGSAREH